ncbi:heavy metal-binding domain-containing protein [Deinococcus sp. KSM4-11]|uniref:heavy metal-binding domain-containing protein n=1 Tax=Deinococcus sp. KSM4-11 TaxID=2568654 RepID=UPI0010A4C594|nr:heavy metal-binding domain-containing protein [Deinococcus sp. KSM4-11]THF83598.1 heavy metal-binding domain-containing protein [Deinococcus sp. KSM4-11]
MPLSQETTQRLDDSRRDLFTSDLSVSEFLLLEELGYQPLGLAMGTSVYHLGLQQARWRESLELTTLTQAMYNARHLAMNRMIEEAKYLGADGIVGMRLDIGGGNLGLESSLAEFIAVGTAVRLPAGETPQGGTPFTSDLSGQDLYKLHRAGYRPVSLVMGTCVYHVAHQGFLQSLSTLGQNVEMTNYTQAIYHARELAMTRMQAEARQAGATGIVGVQVSEHSRIWDNHVFEFLAVGTGVRRVQGATPALQTTLNLSLDE